MEFLVSRRAALIGRLVLGLLVIMAAIGLGRFLSRNGPDASSSADPTPLSGEPQNHGGNEINGTEHSAERAAVGFASAYFTIDELGESGWTDRLLQMADDPQTVLMLGKAVWAALGPVPAHSSPKAVVGVRTCASSDAISHRNWEVWKVDVIGLEQWQGDRPSSIGPLAVPWSYGSSVSVLVAVVETDKGWRFALFPVEALVLAWEKQSAALALEGKDEY